MLEILFRDFWHWLGGLIYLTVICETACLMTSNMVSLFNRRKRT